MKNKRKAKKQKPIERYEDVKYLLSKKEKPKKEVIEMAKTKVDVNLENETKSEKFKRVGTSRLRKAVKAVSNMKNLASVNYESNPEQVEYIMQKLTEAVINVQKAFEKTEKVETEEIKL